MIHLYRERRLLGVKTGSNKEEIIIAYRRAAMRWHPDRAGDTPHAKARFQEIHRAYRRLMETAGETTAMPETPSPATQEFTEQLNPNQQTTFAEDIDISNDWRDDIPWLTLLSIGGGIGALTALQLPFSLIAFSALLLISLYVYRLPQSMLGVYIEYTYKLCVRLYFLCLLAAAVGWLILRVIA